jgi:predicted ester cyclase
MRGTHKGMLFGVSPTGKQVITTAIQIHRIAEGKIQETWANADILSMMYQLGVSTLPSMG